MSSKTDEMRSQKRKLTEAEEAEMKKSNRQERFYLKKLSSDDVAKLIMSSSPETSSVESDGCTSECWAISKSPLKKPQSNRVNRTLNSNQTDSLVVSPVKLKRRPELNKLKNASDVLEQNESNSKENNSKMEKIDEAIEKEILLQIQNSPELKIPKSNCVSSEESLDTKTARRNVTSVKSPKVSSTTPLKENMLKNKLTDSESDLSSVALENIDYVNGTSKKAPKKICKIEETSKKLEVILDRLPPDVINNYRLPDYGEKKSERQTPSRHSRKLKCFEDNDLAVPLDSIGDNCQMKSKGDGNKDKSVKNKPQSKYTDDDLSSESDNEEIVRASKRILNKTRADSTTPRKSSRIQQKTSMSSSKRQKNNSEFESDNSKTSKSRMATKAINYKEDDSDGHSSDILYSGVSSSVVSENIKNLTPSRCTPNRRNTNQTPKSTRSLRIRKKYEMDENSSESSDISGESESDSIMTSKVSLRVGSVKKDNSVKNLSNSSSKNRKNLKENEPSSPNVSSPGRINLRKRSERKQPLADDFEFYDNCSRRSSSVKSLKTSSQSKKESKDVDSETSPEKPAEQSPRFSRRILAKESAKKVPEPKEKLNSETSRTPRSSARNNNLSPLVDSVEKISLRNRSEIKKPWSEAEFEVDLGKRLSIVNSPRTPSHCLRKQVLESTTRSAKKKLIMGSDSSSDDDDFVPLRRTPRKRVTNVTNKTPIKSTTDSPSKKTPNKATPSKSTPNKSTPKRKNEPSTPCTPRTVRRVGQGFLTPMVEQRSVSRHTSSVLEGLRLKLHLSTVPSSLPCRLSESKNIKSFISCKINDKTGGCMYISGVPGTGKTATVHAVVKTLQQEAIDSTITPFDFVEVNSLRLAEARQAYIRIWQSLCGSKVSAEQALHSLEKKFSGRPSRPTVLLIDELDYICNRRQDVVYNVLDWCTKKNSRLIVLTIANTMDLPERTLKGRVTSRMGLTRLVFQPYTFQQLQEIVMNRIEGSSSFDPDAVQFVARKVAAVSGDARRALDICRRATELLENDTDKVTLDHVNKTLSLIYLSRRVQAIKHCTYMGQLLLRAIRDETLRTGVEETTIRDVFSHLISLCNLEGSWQPTLGQVLTLCRTISTSSLISLEKGRHDIFTKITLNVSADDVHYALNC